MYPSTDLENLPDEQASNITNGDVMYEDNFRTMVSEMVLSGAAEASGTSYEDDPTMRVTVTRQSDSQGTLEDGAASYTNLLMSVSAE